MAEQSTCLWCGSAGGGRPWHSCAPARTGAQRRLGGGLDLGFLESSACVHTVLGGLRTCPILYWIALSIRLCVSSTLTCLLRSTPCSLSWSSLPGPWPTLLMPAGNSMQQPPLPSLAPSDVPTLHCILFKLPPIKSCFISVFHVSISWGIPTWPCHDPFSNLGPDVFGTSISPEGLCQHVSCG